VIPNSQMLGVEFITRRYMLDDTSSFLSFFPHARNAYTEKKTNFKSRLDNLIYKQEYIYYPFRKILSRFD